MLWQLLSVCTIVLVEGTSFAPKSSISFGVGYSLVHNKETPVYPRSLDQNAYIVSTTKYENHTWYLYRDTKVDKFYIRDQSCRFMCLNPCGTAFMTNVLVKHYCKFKIEEKDSMHRVYIPSSAVATKNTNYRYLTFDSTFNIVKGVLNLKKSDLVPYTFAMEPTKTNQTGCTKIGKMASLNLDLRQNTRCTLPTVREMTPADVTKELQVVSSIRYFYHLKMNDGYVTSTANINPVMGDYSRFHKEMINTNLYVFRSTDNCNYLCLNKCGVVYMSLKFNDDCKIRIVETTAANNVYLKFDRHQSYLTVNEQGTLTNSTTITYRNQVQLEMTEMENMHAYDKKCSVLRTDSVSDNDDACINVANRIGRSMLPTLFVYFVMKNGGQG